METNFRNYIHNLVLAYFYLFKFNLFGRALRLHSGLRRAVLRYIRYLLAVYVWVLANMREF